MQNKTDPVDPRAIAFKLAVNHAEKQTVAALREKKEKEAPTNIQERQRVGITKNEELKFTGHLPDIQFCAKTVTTY